MPTDILIYAIIAAAMVFWLRSVIGTRHGEERQRPNRFEEKPEDIIDLTPAAKDVMEQNQEGDNIDAGLVQIALADRNFEAGLFKENAADAFSIIVTAFADADRDTLKDLCTQDVYKAFDKAIKAREKAGETVTTEIHAVRKTEVTAAYIEKKEAFVTLRFTADETYLVMDKDGTVIAGDADRVTEMTDKWTFTRNIKSKDPRWLLCKTEDDVIEEDGKTPIPDAG